MQELQSASLPFPSFLVRITLNERGGGGDKNRLSKSGVPKPSRSDKREIYKAVDIVESFSPAQVRQGPWRKFSHFRYCLLAHWSLQTTKARCIIHVLGNVDFRCETAVPSGLKVITCYFGALPPCPPCPPRPPHVFSIHREAVRSMWH